MSPVCAPHHRVTNDARMSVFLQLPENLLPGGKDRKDDCGRTDRNRDDDFTDEWLKDLVPAFGSEFHKVGIHVRKMPKKSSAFQPMFMRVK